MLDNAFFWHFRSSLCFFSTSKGQTLLKLLILVAIRILRTLVCLGSKLQPQFETLLPSSNSVIYGIHRYPFGIQFEAQNKTPCYWSQVFQRKDRDFQSQKLEARSAKYKECCKILAPKPGGCKSFCQPQQLSQPIWRPWMVPCLMFLGSASYFGSRKILRIVSFCLNILVLFRLNGLWNGMDMWICNDMYSQIVNDLDGLVRGEENEVLRLQTAALAQSLAGRVLKSWKSQVMNFILQMI